MIQKKNPMQKMNINMVAVAINIILWKILTVFGRLSLSIR